MGRALEPNHWQQFVQVCLLTGLFLFSGLALMQPSAISSEDTPAIRTPMKLAELNSFEVHMPTPSFDKQNYRVDGEWFAYLDRALKNERRLPVASPGEGQVAITCPEQSCVTVQLQVMAGTDGPMVWQTEVSRRDWGSPWKENALGVALPEYVMAKAVERLADAYEAQQPLEGI